MATDVFPPIGADPLTSLNVQTTSQIGASAATLNTAGQAITVGTTFGQARSGVMVSLSGTYAGARVVFEGNGFEASSPYRTWPAWHMQHGVWVTYDHLVNNSAVSYWIPANGAVNVRMRLTNITSGAVSAGSIAMHAPASIGTGPVGKLDWQLYVVEGTPGNNVATMFTHGSTMQSALVARTVSLNTSYPVPLGMRLRIHSWSGNYLAGAGGGRCVVALRSNLTGATVATTPDILGTWLFGPSAGGVNPDERWSGLASALTEPIDIYNNGQGASVGLSGLGSAGTTGKLNFTLFGYLVG